MGKVFFTWLLFLKVSTHVTVHLIAHLCQTFCDPMDCSSPGSSVHEDSPGKNTGVGCHALLQGIFPTQGSNVGLPHFRQTLYHLSHQGSPNSIFKKDCKYRGFPGGSVGKESICNAGDLGSISGSRRSPGEGNDYPLQYSSLEKSMLVTPASISPFLLHRTSGLHPSLKWPM